MEIWKTEIFGNIMLKTVQNPRDPKEQRKFKYTAAGSYLRLSLAVSRNFSVLFSSEFLRPLKFSCSMYLVSFSHLLCLLLKYLQIRHEQILNSNLTIQTVLLHESSTMRHAVSMRTSEGSCRAAVVWCHSPATNPVP